MISALVTGVPSFAFCVLSNPVEDFLFTILLEGDMLSSLSAMVHPVCEGRLDTKSWTVECSRQPIDEDCAIVT
jgi:hypothetical protein